MFHIEENRQAQAIASRAYHRMLAEIRPGMTEREIKRMAEVLLVEEGSFSFWRFGVGAVVFVGPRTRLSQSTLDYRPTDTVLGETDVVWMDLAPSVDFRWGDYTRCIFLEDGKVVTDPQEMKNEVFRTALTVQLALHKKLRETARPDMSFEELHHEMDQAVRSYGFENLDFLGNYGHSLELSDDDRTMLEPGSKALLGSADGFSFEPHIGRPGDSVAFKWENLYYFDGDVVKEIRE